MLRGGFTVADGKPPGEPDSAALLALEDGTVFRGTAFGAQGEAFGEAVFNTGMAGYQEVLTDPSYAGQIVAMTAPHQGNYGVNATTPNRRGVQVAGFAVREASRRASSWRADGTLTEELAAPASSGSKGSTRDASRLRLRDHGAMRAAISTLDLDAASLVARVQASPAMEGADLAKTVSTTEPYEAAASGRAGGRVARRRVPGGGVRLRHEAQHPATDSP